MGVVNRELVFIVKDDLNGADRGALENLSGVPLSIDQDLHTRVKGEKGRHVLVARPTKGSQKILLREPLEATAVQL